MRVSLSVSVPHDVAIRVGEIAEAEKKPVSHVVQEALKQFLEERKSTREDRCESGRTDVAQT